MNVFENIAKDLHSTDIISLGSVSKNLRNLYDNYGNMVDKYYDIYDLIRGTSKGLSYEHVKKITNIKKISNLEFVMENYPNVEYLCFSKDYDDYFPSSLLIEIKRLQHVEFPDGFEYKSLAYQYFKYPESLKHITIGNMENEYLDGILGSFYITQFRYGNKLEHLTLKGNFSQPFNKPMYLNILEFGFGYNQTVGADTLRDLSNLILPIHIESKILLDSIFNSVIGTHEMRTITFVNHYYNSSNQNETDFVKYVIESIPKLLDNINNDKDLSIGFINPSDDIDYNKATIMHLKLGNKTEYDISRLPTTLRYIDLRENYGNPIKKRIFTGIA